MHRHACSVPVAGRGKTGHNRLLGPVLLVGLRRIDGCIACRRPVGADRGGNAHAKKSLHVVLPHVLALQVFGTVRAGVLHAKARTEVGRRDLTGRARAPQWGYHDGTFVHIGLDEAFSGLGQEVCSPYADRCNGGVEPVSLGLFLGCAARNLPYSPPQKI